MLLRLARILHILHNYVEPREWALNHLQLVLVPSLSPSFAA
jgi:hypothetical protein